MADNKQKISLKITPVDTKNQTRFKNFAPLNFTELLIKQHTYALGAVYKRDELYVSCGLIPK